jgi:glycosyltransferase involved in cell wall biosynthesis
MRISIYHNSLWAKYKGVVFSELYRLSQGSGLEISIIQIAETDDERLGLGDVDLTYHNYPFRLIFRGSYGAVRRLRMVVGVTRDLLRHPADVVVLSGYDRIENWAMLFTCMALRRKRAVFCDSTRLDKLPVWWKELAKRFFFACCDGFFGYGQRSKEYLMSLGAAEADIIVPCVAAALPPSYDAAEILTEYRRLPAARFDPPRWLYLGRLAPEKSLPDLLDAFSRVRSQIPGAHLDVVGAGPLRDALTERIRELNLTDAVTLHGYRSLQEIVQLFMSSVAMVLPSHTEPWGLVVNESLSYACPVIVSSRCGCVPELVVEQVTGYVFEAHDIEALTAAMINVRRLSENRSATAERCVAVASAFTAERAALRLLEGCAQIAGRAV